MNRVVTSFVVVKVAMYRFLCYNFVLRPHRQRCHAARSSLRVLSVLSFLPLAVMRTVPSCLIDYHVITGVWNRVWFDCRERLNLSLSGYGLASCMSTGRTEHDIGNFTNPMNNFHHYTALTHGDSLVQ